MGVQKRVRKFAKVKRVIGQQDARLYVHNPWSRTQVGLADVVFARKKNQAEGEVVAKRKAKGDEIVREMYVPKALSRRMHTHRFIRPQVSSSLFFQYNTALVPPFSVLIDTNFLSLVQSDEVSQR